MATADFFIKFEIEPVCKVVCLAENCANNMLRFLSLPHCNLKHISLNEQGGCRDFTPRETKMEQGDGSL